ncbi:hypothetical protein IWW38_004462, partial [Coemansia aciculifera]
MPVLPFTEASTASVLLANTKSAQTDIGKHRAASGHGNGRLKRWLSLKKINIAYRQSSSDSGAGTPAQPSKLKRSAVVSSRSQQQSKSSSSCYDDGNYNKQVASADGDMELPSTPIPKLVEDAAATRGTLPLLSLLHHRFSSPDLHCLRAPPPTVDKGKVGGNDTNASLADCLGLADPGEHLDDKLELRPLPPRRKRSLIYAMYCTAKADDPATPAPA